MKTTIPIAILVPLLATSTAMARHINAPNPTIQSPSAPSKVPSRKPIARDILTAPPSGPVDMAQVYILLQSATAKINDQTDATAWVTKFAKSIAIDIQPDKLWRVAETSVLFGSRVPRTRVGELRTNPGVASITVDPKLPE